MGIDFFHLLKYTLKRYESSFRRFPVFTDYLYTFLISMIPIAELRASVIFGAAKGLEWYYVIPISIIGNLIPVPFILLFIRKIIAWMTTTKHFSGVANWLVSKAEKHSTRVLRYAFFGLVLFVGIPLPGTGAWTGALVAALFDLRMKSALPAIFLGLLLASAIMGAASYGAVGFLSFLAS
ncbi:MAG: small multi-drug export protein [Clostridia bacterium]|nr:small multi-drug export protein [Clostridia bacterium]